MAVVCVWHSDVMCPCVSVWASLARFGRASEDPSEDPYLAGHYASEWLQGSQKKDRHGKYPLMITMLKHFAAYSQEHNRGGDDYFISQHDLFETYLAQYEIAFVEGT